MYLLIESVGSKFITLFSQKENYNALLMLIWIGCESKLGWSAIQRAFECWLARNDHNFFSFGTYFNAYVKEESIPIQLEYQFSVQILISYYLGGKYLLWEVASLPD